MTADLVTQEMTPSEAERLTLRISLKLGILADTYESVMPMIRDALDRGIHQVLGYPSPGAYLSDRFGDALSRLGVEVRREVVGELAAAGLSTRAIAPIVGVDNATVHRDLARVADATPAVARPAKITGVDGKTYQRPERADRRRPWPTAARDAALDLSKRVNTITNLIDDDRFPGYAADATGFCNDITRAIGALQAALARAEQHRTP